MNPLIENLNGWADNFLRFAWSMLWQSSLLIALVLTLDFLFARKIGASVRYAIWLMVLVKLVLPPAFALPTSAAWWLFQPKPAIQAPAVPQKYTVTYDNPMPQMEISQTPEVVPAPPKPKLNGAAWLLVTSAAFSFALLTLLIYRWRQVTQKVHSANAAEKLSIELERAKFLAEAHSLVRLKIIDAEMSPAVCGLFHPVILLPRALAEKLTPEQLRAVLLHEIFHLRRRDVWVNCAQAFLQIFYWWHPLLWIANARIRCVREEAVDDAVMLALRDEAETYAPTLLEVAKLALRRPLMSLGLVGIMESRSALRQRVERLVDFHAPRRAGLTLLSVLGIFAFSAVALPMGEAPKNDQTNGIIKVEDEGAIVPANTNRESTPLADNYNMPVKTVPAAPQTVLNREIPTRILIQTWIFQAPSTLKSVVDNETTITTNVSSFAQLQKLREKLKANGWQMTTAPRIVAINGEPAKIYIGSTNNSVSLSCLSIATNGIIKLKLDAQVVNESNNGLLTNEFQINKTATGNICAAQIHVTHPNDSGLSNLVALVSAEIVTNTTRFQQRLNKIVKPANSSSTDSPAMSDAQKVIVSKLKTIRLESFSCDHLSLNQVLGQLAVLSKSNDVDHVGINLAYLPIADDSAQPKIDPDTGLPIPISSQRTTEMDATKILVTVPALQNPTLGDVLDAVVKGTAQPVHYEVHDYGIQFQPGNPPLLFTRTFKLDPQTFIASLKKTGIDFGSSTNSSSVAARDFCKSLGIDMDSPAGKAIFFNDRSGILLVRATEKDLEMVDKAIQVLNYLPPEIHIKARFIEIIRDKSSTNNLYDWYLGQFTLTGTNAATSYTSEATNSRVIAPPSLTGVLTDKNFDVVLHALNACKGVKDLGEPEVTTTSGRQTQMRVTQVVTVLTNFAYQGSTSNRLGEYSPQTEQLETGPVLDVVPYVLADGYTISLALIPSVTEFLGYDQPPDVPNLVGTSQNVQLPVFLPRVSRRQMVANLNVWDGQTVVLGGVTETRSANTKEPVLGNIPGIGKLFRHTKTEEADLLVFITATLVDTAGKRIHSDDEMPFAQKGPPMQPQSKGTNPVNPLSNTLRH